MIGTSKSLRVAYLVNQYPSVSHTFIRREIEALERLGVAVDRVSVRGWDLPLVDVKDQQERGRTRYLLQQGVLPLLRALVVAALTAPGPFLKSFRLSLGMADGSGKRYLVHLAYLAEACLMASWMKAAGACHLHAHFATNPAEVALYVHTLTGVDFSFTAHGSDIMDRPMQMKLAEKIGAAKFVAAVCSYGRAQMIRWIPHALWGKVHVVHCGLNFGPDGEAAVAAGAVGVPEQTGRPRHFVCVGRLSKEKGQILLLQAVDRLKSQGLDLHVTLVGDGPMRADLEHYIDAHGLREQVRITGWLDAAQVTNELRQAASLVVPSLSEGLPVVIMEAMAHRLSVIAPYLAGIPELVIDGETGWLYPAGDVDAMARAMERALTSSGPVGEQIVTQARIRVRARHDVDVEARKLLDLIATRGLAA